MLLGTPARRGGRENRRASCPVGAVAGAASVDVACRESSWDSCLLATAATAELALASGTPVIGMALNHVPSDSPPPLPLLSARTNGAFFPIVDPSQIALALRSLPAVAGHTVGFHRLRFEIPASADSLRAFRPGNTMAARLTLQTAGGARTEVGVSLQVSSETVAKRRAPPPDAFIPQETLPAT